VTTRLMATVAATTLAVCGTAIAIASTANMGALVVVFVVEDIVL